MIQQKMKTWIPALVGALAVVGVPAGAKSQTEEADKTGWNVAAFAGGGFAGRSVRSAVQFPAYSVDAEGEAFLVSDSVDLRRDGTFNWRPTVSTGVVARYVFESDWYAGGSAYFAFLTEDDSETRPSPGLAIHLGQGNVGLFVGYVFTASHDIALPRGESRLRVAKDNIPDLRTTNTDTFGRIYIGFSGVSLDMTRLGTD